MFVDFTQLYNNTFWSTSPLSAVSIFIRGCDTWYRQEVPEVVDDAVYGVSPHLAGSLSGLGARVVAGKEHGQNGEKLGDNST